MNGRFLDSPDPLVRRISAVAYAAATGAAEVAWDVGGGFDALRAGKVFLSLADALIGLPVWWLVAGAGLRLVRRVEDRRRARPRVPV